MTSRTLTAALPQPVRYVLAAGANTLFYIGLTLLLAGPAGLPIQVAIPVAYAGALVTHFGWQRLFVFAQDSEFVLPVRSQIARYAVIAAFQYPATAAATAVLPGVFDASERAVYVVTVLVIAAVTFVVLRSRVFHAH